MDKIPENESLHTIDPMCSTSQKKSGYRTQLARMVNDRHDMKVPQTHTHSIELADAKIKLEPFWNHGSNSYFSYSKQLCAALLCCVVLHNYSHALENL